MRHYTGRSVPKATPVPDKFELRPLDNDKPCVPCDWNVKVLNNVQFFTSLSIIIIL